MAKDQSKKQAEAAKVVAEQPKTLNIPTATYRVQVKNNAHIRDVQSRQPEEKQQDQ
jgi:hypothetical protein